MPVGRAASVTARCRAIAHRPSISLQPTISIPPPTAPSENTTAVDHGATWEPTPLAAKYALGLLRKQQLGPLDRLKFFREIRRGMVEYLAEVLELSTEERRAIEGLAVFRRPIPPELVRRLPLTDLEDTIESLGDKFLIEEQEGGLCLVGVIREHALDAWSGARNPEEFHRAGAHYYEGLLGTDTPPAERHFARREATYHYTALRDFGKAQALRTNWQRDAVVASEVLFKTRQHQACIEVCDEILAVHNDAFVRSRKLVSLAWTMQLERAKVEMHTLRETRAATAWTYGAYAAALLKKGAGGDALTILLGGVERFPQDAYLRAGLAEYYAQKNDDARALDMALEATELNPHNLKAHVIASDSARRLGTLDLAYDHALKGMAIDPSRAQSSLDRVVSAIRKRYDGKSPEEVFGHEATADERQVGSDQKPR